MNINNAVSNENNPGPGYNVIPQPSLNNNNNNNNNIYPHDIPQSILIGKPLLIFTSIFVSICVFLFGYDQGYFSSIIVNPYFKDEFNNPSSLQIGTVVAILEIGALITSLSLTLVADKLGRRKTTRLGSFLFSIGGLVQTFSNNLIIMGIGRFISGMGVGFLSGTAPTYMIEISSSEQRGFLGCVQFTGNILGYSSSIWLDYFCSFINNNLSFRIPLASQVFFGLILFFGSYILVESPRWLLEHDHDEEGLIVIADLFTNGEVHHNDAINEFKNIKENILINRIQGKLNFIKTIKRYPKRLFIACSAQMFAQFNGINVIAYYAPLVFEHAGWEGRDALKMTGINSLIYLASTLIPWKLSESWGRRPLLIFGGFGMGLSLILISFTSYLKNSLMVVIFVAIYMSMFGISWGPIGWLIGPEVLPNKARSSGSSLATATNWICNFIVGQSAPILLEKISWRLYLIHSISCFISMIIVFYIYPETKGLSLEEMELIFNDSSKSTKSSRNPSIHGSFINSSDLENSTIINPLIPPNDNIPEVEIPSLKSIHKFKTDDSKSIRSFKSWVT
jgi:sugar porter (SP) family MFS transporter